MASSVTWDALRELAAFHAGKGCAISLYLDLHPSVTINPGDVQTRVNSLIDEATRSTSATRANLTHEQKGALKADLERIGTWVATEMDRDGARGIALFCAGLDNFWRTLALADAVQDAIKVNRDFYLSPLLPLVGRGDGVIVAAVSRERGEVFRLRGGRLEPFVDRTEEVPNKQSQGGWSQARYARRVDNAALEHMRNVAEVLDRVVRRLRQVKIVIVCPEDQRSDIAGMLADETRAAVVGWAQAEAHAGPPELLEVATPVLESWRAHREADAVERWREQTARGSRGTAGWAPTLEAASDGRVDLLLVQEAVDRPAWRCPACGRLAADTGKCPLDGTVMERRDEGVDLAVHQTLSHGGTVMVVHSRPDLEPVEGIGALLRF
jgi:peptide subunit release factor 1 (eRF1)